LELTDLHSLVPRQYVGKNSLDSKLLRYELGGDAVVPCQHGDLDAHRCQSFHDLFLLVARTASATAKAPSSRPSMAARISVLPGLLDVVILKDSGSLKMPDEFLSISSQATILTMTT
jgi:hypothetical protein